MVAPKFFYDRLAASGVAYFSGVPDSLLKGFCAYLMDHAPAQNHVIAANEGAAVGLAIGYHLATGRTPLVYMQNSGLGNTVNPLMSLADGEVYSIPMLLLIGWRGEPGIKDEPQHVKQGRVTLATLDAMEIPHEIINGEESQAEAALSRAFDHIGRNRTAFALVVRKGAFDEYRSAAAETAAGAFRREDAIKAMVSCFDDRDIVVATTGMASRELFEHREALGQGHERDFLMVGGMGHACQVAMGIATQKPDRRVVCIDGDGAAIMHLGSLATNGWRASENFKHVIINNGAHASVGGQPTAGFAIDFPALAIAAGYRHAATVSAAPDLASAIGTLWAADGPALLEVRVEQGHRKDLGRPTTTPLENKVQFMNFVREG